MTNTGHTPDSFGFAVVCPGRALMLRRIARQVCNLCRGRRTETKLRGNVETEVAKKPGASLMKTVEAVEGHGVKKVLEATTEIGRGGLSQREAAAERERLREH